MFELIRAEQAPLVALIAGFVVLAVVVGVAVGLARRLRLGRLGHRARHRRRRSPSPRTGRPTRSRSPSAAPSRPTRSSTGGCTTSSRACASPAGLPKPGVYIVDDPAPNAFATGRNPKHAAIAVTTGLLEKLNRVELEGVIAHELSHIRNYDILVSTLAVTLVGFVAMLTDIAIRMMWWNGGRVPARATTTTASNPLALRRLRVADRRSDRRQGDAGGGQPPARDARRRQRVPAHALSTGADLALWKSCATTRR